MTHGTRPTRSHRRLAYSAAAAAIIGAGSPAFAQAPETDAPAFGVEDIVVTARRKEEKNQDVPVAITAFSNERIQEMNIVSTQGLQSSVPSLVIGSNGQGLREVESPTIRGQGATFQASPGVVVYSSEAPLPGAITLSSQGGPGNYLDLQNVQVLKGPQGTLFGRNTTGGAILLTPQRPTDRNEGYIQLQGGNYNDREVQAVVNIPVIEDKLLVRFAGEMVDRDGFTRDLTFNKDRDDKHYWTGRLGVTWRPTDKVENYIVAYNTWSRNNGTGNVAEAFNLGIYGLPAALGGYNQCDSGLGGGVGPCSDYQALIDAQKARGIRKVAFGVDTYSKIKTWGATDILDIQLSDNLTIRNIANYSELKNFYSYDGDGTIANAYDGNPFTARTIPRDDIRQYSEELQLQGKALNNRLDYVVGGFYFKNEPNGLQSSQSLIACPLAFSTFCGDPGPTGDGALNPFASVSIYGVTSESYAAYAQGTYDLGGVTERLDGLRLTLGYRYTWDKVDGFNTAYTFDPGTSTYFCTSDASVSLSAGGCTYTGHLQSSRPTWIAGLDYKLRSNVLLYGKVSTGYKSGGFSTFSVRPSTRTFGPEEVTAYELGVKSDFTVFDAPVRLNVDVFQTDYEKIQRASSDFNVVTGASGAQTLSSASARMRGIEIEAVIKPTKYLELGGNYSYIDAEYTKFPYVVGNPFGHEDCSGAIIPFGGNADMSCLPMQYLAPNIVNAYAKVSFRDNVSLFLNYAWTDDQHTEALQLEKNQPGERLESYGLLSASFDWRQINGGNVDLSIFATNLTDEEYRISPAGVYEAGAIGVAASIYGEPRMVGARLKYHWGG